MENLDSKQIRPGLKRKSLVFGLVVLALGFIWLFHNFGMINETVWDHIISWQMLLIAIGVINLANGHGRGFGGVLILIGGFFLLSDIYGWPVTFTQIFWPSLLILVGLFLLSGSSRIFRRRFVSIGEGEDYIDEVSVFSGTDRVIHSKSFKGGKVVSIFGGSKLDLSRSTIEPGIHELEVVAIFGGSTLIVPADWNVKVEIFSIFGGFEDKRMIGQIDFSKTLILKGVAIFGGGEVKTA
jgi:predicted membrane protein